MAQHSTHKRLYIWLLAALAVLAVGALVYDVLWARPPAADLPAPGQTHSAAGLDTGEPVTELAGAQQLSAYHYELRFEPHQLQLRGELTLHYVNNESQPMSELHFQLWANSHERAEYGIFAAEDMPSAYPNGFSPGSIAIAGVYSAGAELNWVVSGAQRHVLQVQLPRSLEMGQSCELSMQYTVKIPNSLGRFGYGDNTWSLANCNPTLAVFEDGRWKDYPYYPMGDPFYTDVADFTATIRAPQGYTLAATGVLTHQDTPDGDTLWHVSAPARRDFAFVASDRFVVGEAQTRSGVRVRSYYLEDCAPRGQQALHSAVESIELFGKLYGAYPYGEFAVVQADFFIGGMEYPGMVLVDSSLYQAHSPAEVFDLIAAHETAHQWWYALVGNNQVEAPWLDEALTEFSTRVFFERRAGADLHYYQRYEAMIDTLRLQYPLLRVDLPVYDYDDALGYSAWVYYRGSQVFDQLRDQMGEQALFSALSDYYSKNALGIATRSQLEAALESQAGTDLTAWMDEQFARIQAN